MARWLNFAAALQLLAAVVLQPAIAVRAAGADARDGVLHELASRACAALRAGAADATPITGVSASRDRFVLDEACDAAALTGRPPGASALVRLLAATNEDGTVVGRRRIAQTPATALDVIAYLSDGLIVGGLLCYPNDGQPHSTVIHVPGGAGGVFSGAAGDMVQTCINWASLHGRTAFAPSLRGQDGGQGRAELCLGEANDVVAAATMLRTLEVVDGARVGLVGGSIGGCVALRAAPRIPNLAAVVAFVPPTSWKDLVRYHRTDWQPAIEVDCSGGAHLRDVGGPAFADALDSLICGHEACSDAEYLARSPLPYVAVQAAPTLIVSAEKDNLVPLEQHLLWSVFRQSTGHPVSVIQVDMCDPPGTPPAVMDAHVLALNAFHLLAAGPVSSGMLFLMRNLDALSPIAAKRDERWPSLVIPVGRP